MTAKPCVLQFFSYWGNLNEQKEFLSIRAAKQYVKTHHPMAYFWQIYEKAGMETICYGTCQ
mgnify:CR=1 FL=1